MMNHPINNIDNQESLTIDDPRILCDSEIKRQKIRAWLAESGNDALIIARRENFSWLTTGADSFVVNSSQNSIGCLLITKDGQFLVSHIMDGKRLMDEQLPSQNYELIEMH